MGRSNFHQKILLAAICLFSLLISGCPGTPTNEKRAASTSSYSNDIIGTWKITSMVEEGTSTDYSEYDFTVSFTATSYTLSLPPACTETGTWSIAGNTLTYTAASGACGDKAVGQASTTTIAINGDSMSWKGDTTTILFQRQSGSPTSAVPAAPTGVNAAGGDGKVTLSWSPVAGASSYNIYWASTTGVTKTNGQKISDATSPAELTTTNGFTYYMVVTAVNATGESAASQEVSATSSAVVQSQLPGIVSGITATPGNGQVSLAWNAVGGATSYNVYYVYSAPGAVVPVYSMTIGTGNVPSHYSTSGFTKKSGVTSSQYVHTGLTNGGTYQYLVTAVNANGEGYATSKVTAVPAAPAATDPLLAKTELLKGTWHFVYTIISTFTDDYTLSTIDGNKNSQGGYFITGTDQYGDPVTASYFPTDGNWALLDPGSIIDKFYTFYINDGGTILANSCYYQIDKSTGNSSSCYTLTGSKTASLPAPELSRSIMLKPDDELKAMSEADAVGAGESIKQQYNALKMFSQ